MNYFIFDVANLLDSRSVGPIDFHFYYDNRRIVVELGCFVTPGFIQGRQWSQSRDCNYPLTAAQIKIRAEQREEKEYTMKELRKSLTFSEETDRI